MEIIALIISILSLIASITIALFQFFQNRKNNRLSIEAEYFDEIFKEFLLKDLPKNRKIITFGIDYKLKNTSELIESLNNLRHDTLYFQYTDKEFYKQLKDALSDLEDYIIDSQNKEMIGEEQVEFYVTMQEKIQIIYKILSLKHFGK